MAITDENFTAEEFKTVLSKKPELLKEVKGVLSNDFKHIVQDETEHNTFKAQHEATVASNMTKTWAALLEKDVKELTGIDKADPNEKYYDYFKRATAEKLKAVNSMQEELDRLKAAGSPNKADKDRIAQLEKAIADKETEGKTLKEDYEKKIRNLTIGNDIDNEIAKIRAQYRKDLPPSAIAAVEKDIKARLMATAETDENGRVTYKDAEGKMMVDPANQLPRTTAFLVSDALKELIDPGRQQSGGGSGPGTQEKGGTGPNGLPAVDTLPEGVKSKRELRAHLLKLGYLDGQKEFITIMKKLGEAHKLPA